MFRVLTSVVVWGLAVLPCLGFASQLIPFTTYSAEEKAIRTQLPCKWISLNDSSAGGHYDFLCKGGTWATLSLYLNRNEFSPDGIKSVKLIYRDWRTEVNPNGGEAFIAEKFLTHVVDRFVPSNQAAEVLRRFWTDSSGSWQLNGVKVGYSFENKKDFAIRKLEINGNNQKFFDGVLERINELTEGIRKSDDRNSNGGLLTPTVEVETLQPEVRKASPAVALPRPVDSGSEEMGGGRKLVIPENIPASTPAPSPLEKVQESLKALVKGQEVVSPVIPQASPAELNTAPDPESLVKPVPPPSVSATLVPDSVQMLLGRERAPTNFDAYNKAVDLTKDVEKRALGTPAKDKIIPAQETLKPVAQPQAAPSLKALPAPAVSEALSQRESRTGLENLESVVPVKTDPRLRPLPQLKFVPKAEPLKNPDETIRFEDEGSKL